MSRITSYEKFFIGRIALGLDYLGGCMEKDDLEKLLSQSLTCDVEFKEKIKNALKWSFDDDVKKFNKKIVIQDPSEFWDETFIKLYKGRETLLRDIIIEWYPIENKPTLLDIIKSFFKK